MTEENKILASTGTTAKRDYSTPCLREYGNVAELTQGGSFVGNDGNTKCTGNASTTPECATS